MKTNRVLVIFCDGSGLDGILADPNTGLRVDAKPKGSKQLASNVLRLSRSIKEYSADGTKRQVVYYQSGVASFADFEGDPNIFDTILEAAGTVVASKIRDAYAFIAQNYEEGDEIALFGFSRGSYTARKVAGLIDRIGLLTREDLGLFFTIWTDLMQGHEPSIPTDTRTVNIKLVAVYDTVGSVLNVENALSIKDNSLPNSIDNAIQALSIHENREKFLCTLWAEPSSGHRKGQVLKQVWFSGNHGDVAGCGGDRHELGDVVLFWMVGEIKDLLNIDLDFITRMAQPKPEAWGASQPHNSYDDVSLGIEREVLGHKTRLEGGQITKDSIFHSSFQFSPDAKDLKQPSDMVSMTALKAKFGAGWVPTYAPLNGFEKGRKDTWGDLSGESGAGVASVNEVSFEDNELRSFSRLVVKGI